MPDLPREGPGGRLEPPGEGGGPARDRRATLVPTEQAIPIAGALLAAGSLLVLGAETNTLATTVGDLTGATRSFEIAVFTATVLGTLVCIAAAAAGTAVRSSERWQTAGWAAILALAITRLFATAPLLFWRLGSGADYSVPLWIHITSAVAWLIAALLLVAGLPVGRST